MRKDEPAATPEIVDTAMAIGAVIGFSAGAALVGFAWLVGG